MDQRFECKNEPGTSQSKLDKFICDVRVVENKYQNNFKLYDK